VWEEPFLYKLCGYGIYRKCFPDDEVVVSCTIAMLQLMVATLDQIK